MATAVRKNAIEKRLDILVGLWNEFAEDAEARVLRWLVDADEARMIDVFLEVQNDEGGDIPDLFMRFEEPFVDPTRYGFALLESLQQQYEEIRQGIREEGIAADWVCPSPQPGQSDIQAFVRGCQSLREHYQAPMVHLVVVLMPRDITNDGLWQGWLRLLVRAGLPENLRVMLVDDPDAPILALLAQAEPVLVTTVAPELDMSGAMLELVRSIPGSGPGFTFRRLFVALTNAAAQEDLQAANQAAKAALAIAQKQGWPHMQVVVHMALGAAYLGAKKAAEALICYRQASHTAANASAQGEPMGPKLVLQSTLAEGAALVSDGQHTEAARVYEKAASLAESQQEVAITLESWRMAAYCYGVAKQPEASWRCGHLALDAAERLDPETWAMSMLPFVGQGLLRLVPWWKKKLARALRERMIKLAGPDWEQQLTPEHVAL